MTSFFAVQHYSPVLILLVGVLSFTGASGVGMLILRLVGVTLPTPWRQVAGVLLGIQALSLAVEAVGMTGTASRPVLAAIWGALVIAGAVGCWRHATPLAHDPIARPRAGYRIGALVLLLIAAAGLLLNLVAALAPSSKFDEVYCYMVLPGRIVLDRALRFYIEPWTGYVLAQMVYPLAGAPMHALGVPDAPNIMSWGLQLTLVWFAWFLVAERLPGGRAASLAAAAIPLGMYAVVFPITGASHAMGDLATAAAVVALFRRKSLLKQIDPVSFAALCSVLTLASATSKVSLLPLSAVILILLMGWLIKQPEHASTRAPILLAAALPWLVFYLPLLVFTFRASGSPLGAILAGKFGWSIYDLRWVQIQFRAAWTSGHHSWSAVAFETVIRCTPVIWLGMLGAAATRVLTPRDRLLAGCLLGGQLLIIWRMLPWDSRFLGGLEYGLAIVFALAASRLSDRLASRVGMGVALLLLVPWLGIQGYYARQFFPVVLGFQRPAAFCERYLAFYDDFLSLDRKLPKTAVILVAPGLRVDTAYFPRPTFLYPADLPGHRDVYLFALGMPVSPPRGYRLGPRVFIDTHAKAETFRTPGSPPVLAALEVWRLIPVHTAPGPKHQSPGIQ